MSVLLNRPKRRRRSVVSRHYYKRNPLSVIGLNPKHRKRSRRRHNPVSSVLGGGSGVMGTVKSLAVLGISAGIGGVVTKLAPGFLGVNVLTNQWMRYGAQFGVGVVGCMIVSKFVSKQHGVAFGIGAVSVIVMDLIQGWLLTMTVTPTTGTAGFGAPGSYTTNQYRYPGYPGNVGVFPSGRVGAFTRPGTKIPGNVGGMGAFVDPYHG